MPFLLAAASFWSECRRLSRGRSRGWDWVPLAAEPGAGEWTYHPPGR